MPDAPLFLNECSRAPTSPQAGSLREPLHVVEQIKRMRGGTQSHLMRCADNRYYVVKFQDNPQGTRILTNELLGTLLAARLGLPTNPARVCYVGKDIIELTPDLCFEVAKGRTRCKPGLQFGSLYATDPRRTPAVDFLSDDHLPEVENLRDFAGMLVFDKWTCNVDGRQTVFNRTGTDVPYRAVMIDQGFCFNASEWNFPDAPLRGLFDRKAVYDDVRGLHDFEPWLTILETQVNEAVMIELAKKIPPEWYESNLSALETLLEWLDRRRGRVRELLWDTWMCVRSRGIFPNWNLTLALGEVASSGEDIHVSTP